MPLNRRAVGESNGHEKRWCGKHLDHFTALRGHLTRASGLS